jgi:hypothetical protein
MLRIRTFSEASSLIERPHAPKRTDRSINLLETFRRMRRKRTKLKTKCLWS